MKDKRRKLSKVLSNSVERLDERVVPVVFTTSPTGVLTTGPFIPGVNQITQGPIGTNTAILDNSFLGTGGVNSGLTQNLGLSTNLTNFRFNGVGANPFSTGVNNLGVVPGNFGGITGVGRTFGLNTASTVGNFGFGGINGLGRTFGLNTASTVGNFGAHGRQLRCRSELRPQWGRRCE